MIVAGMTPAEFIVELNLRFDQMLAGYTTALITNTGTELQTVINDNFSKYHTLIGMKGSDYISIINSDFAEHDTSLDKPTNLAVVWAEDYAGISFTDTSTGEAQHEIWEQIESGSYALAQTLGAGVDTCNYKTYQMADINYRVRSKKGSLYSPFTDLVNINTPLVIFTNQVESFREVNFRQIKLDDASSVSIVWGDGDTTADYTPIGNVYDEVNHTYTVPGDYWIHVTGAADKFSVLQFYEQPVEGTDITKWIWRFGFCHLWTNGFIGDVTNIQWATGIGGLHLASNPLITGNIDSIFTQSRPNFWDCHMPVAGDGSLWDFTNTPKLAHLLVEKLTGDISHWRFPKNNDYRSWIISLRGTPTGDISNLFAGTYQYLHSISLPSLQLEGDLSGWDVGADYSSAGGITLNNNKFTKLPRGNFYKFATFNCAANLCNSDEIDAILAAIDASVTANAPEYNCVYTLNETGMGIPTAAGLASKASIEAKYVAAEKTISILVNS